MKHALLIISVGILVVAGILGYSFMAKKSSLTPAVSNESNTTSPTGTELITSNPDVSHLKQGGASYLDPRGVYTILYPNDYTIEPQNPPNYTRIYKRAQTARSQGEITDGVLMVFESVDLDGKALSDFVDTRIREVTANGTGTILEPKKAITLNTYPGYTYKTGGFGEATYVVLQKDANSPNAISISYSVMDPQQKNYQTEVDGILSTVELLK